MFQRALIDFGLFMENFPDLACVIILGSALIERVGLLGFAVGINLQLNSKRVVNVKGRIYMSENI
jgi:hypothetical protein